MNKKVRIEVWEKCNHHCAYCGTPLDYKDMQVDHLVPRSRKMLVMRMDVGVHHISNLMPSCRKCNFYKSSYTVEEFRGIMKTLHERILKPFISRLGFSYGIVIIKPFDGVFFFER